VVVVLLVVAAALPDRQGEDTLTHTHTSAQPGVSLPPFF
jgi:hypothetical protein